MGAVFGIAGTYSEHDIRNMQANLRHRSSSEPRIHRYDTGFVGCFDSSAGSTPNPETGSDTLCVVDGYLDRKHSREPHTFFNAGDDHGLAGLYAIACFTPSTGSLRLLRDPSGARPLYYAVENARCIFASSPKAILAAAGFARELNPAGVSLYLSMICPADPVTIFRSIDMLRPGFQLVWNEKKTRVSRFWTPAGLADSKSASPASAAQQLRSALEQAVLDAIPPDHRNTGFFLSGGTDTGAVVGLAARAGISPIHTFTIGYEGTGSGYDAYNEFHYAKLISDRFHTVHHEFIVSPETVTQSLPGIVSGLDQPSGDAINTYLVAGSLPSNIHTVLTGTGGDEIFIGSHWFKQQERLQRLYGKWRRIPGFLRRRAAMCTEWIHPPLARRIHRLQALEGGVPAQYRHFKMLFDPEQILHPDFLLAASGMVAPAEIVEMYDELHRDSDPVNRMESLLFHHEVSNLQLRDVDAMTHAHGCEARSPLVDRRVLDVLHTIPGPVKAPGGSLRHLMFQALDDCLMIQTRTRRKMSFIVPMDLWARRELRPAIERLVSREVVEKRGILLFDAVQKERDAFYTSGRERHPFKIWNLALLELWCRFHMDAPIDATPPDSLEDLL